MTTKQIITLVSSILLFIVLIFGAFKYVDTKHNTEIANLNTKIVQMDSQIQIDKNVVSVLQDKLNAQVNAIAPAKIKANTSKTAAIQNVEKLETEQPTEKAEIEAVASPFEIALTDEQKTTEATQAALDTSQSENQAQAVLITDQSTQINTVKQDLAATTTELKTETTRKKMWRDSALISVGMWIVHIVFHI